MIDGGIVGLDDGAGCSCSFSFPLVIFDRRLEEDGSFVDEDGFLRIFFSDGGGVAAVETSSVDSIFVVRRRFFFAACSSSPFSVNAIGFRIVFSVGVGSSDTTNGSCVVGFVAPSSSSSIVGFRRRVSIEYDT